MGQDYFARFHDFDHDPTASLTEEFRRLAVSRHWKEGGKVYRRQRQHCFEGAFGQHFRGDRKSLRGWQELCEDVSLETMPPSITQCKKVSLSWGFITFIDAGRSSHAYMSISWT